ncbi:MAG: hypothetical protein HN337_07880 [Deltaproteobacteria bacterium]|jgi:hypothetical protein|nr:hypothetical protein [Deltaproteobacteria bacterium]
MVRALQYSSVPSSFHIADQIHPYRFCHPNLGGNPFYVALSQSIPTKNDQTVLNHLLGGQVGQAVAVPLQDLPQELPSGFRYYDITSAIPPYVQEKLGTSEYIPGPNCYHAVMTTQYGDRFRERYVHDEEIGYYLTRDFQVSARRDLLGSALIYTRSVYGSSGMSFAEGVSVAGGPEYDIKDFGLTTFGIFTMQMPGAFKPSRIPRAIGESEGHGVVKKSLPDLNDDDFVGDEQLFSLAPDATRSEGWKVIPTADPGVHGAIMLLGGMVFQKGCFGDHCGYRIVPADKGMSSIEIKQERFAPRREPENDAHYRYTSYVRSNRDPVERFGFNLELSNKLASYVTLMEHYLGRFRGIKDKSWKHFNEARIDLLSVENMWGVLRDMEKLMYDGEPSKMNALLRIDPTIAEMFLELKSLRWQYQVMTDKYAPFPDRWSRDRVKRELAELYRDHYVNPDSEIFRDEVVAHLKIRGVAEASWSGVIAAVVERVKTYDPVEFSSSNGAKGIPFSDLLDEIIGSG